MKERITIWGYAAAWRLVRALPERVAWSIFRAGADRAVKKRGPGVQRLHRNLSQVIGAEASDELLRDAMRSYSRYWLQAFRLPSLSPEEIGTCFRLDDWELLRDAHKAGTGAVVALPHAGNWDAAGAWVVSQGLPLTTVAERLKPEAVYQRFLDFREGLGMKIVPLTGGPPPMNVLEDALRQAHIVPLLADRDLSSRGIEVEFLGGRTRMPAGPAFLALRTGAPLFVVALWYEGALPVGRVMGPLPLPQGATLDVRVRELTQAVADRLAEGIAQHPADWHMLQKLWLS